jgi:hypothetical protein
MAKLSERVQERQERRTRQPLPPSHPRLVSSPTEALTEEAGAQVIDLTANGGVDDSHSDAATEAGVEPAQANGDGVIVAGETPVAVTPPPPAWRVAAPRQKAKSPEPSVAVPLEPRQVWLDRENDLWLTECEYANVRSGGRKVISRSSVVRLALERLREAMTPEQITDLLAGREPVQTSRGRPRRLRLRPVSPNRKAGVLTWSAPAGGPLPDSLSPLDTARPAVP